jgi:hypothetical protein
MQEWWRSDVPAAVMDGGARSNARRLPLSPQGLTAANGARGTRTPDLLGAIQALSQLSYSPEHTGRRRAVSEV